MSNLLNQKGLARKIRRAYSIILNWLPKKNWMHPNKPCIFYDVSRFWLTDNKTGIHRVVKKILEELLRNSNKLNYEIIPVGATFYRRGYFPLLYDLDKSKFCFQRCFIKPKKGDTFLSFESDLNVQSSQKDVLLKYKDLGCEVVIGVHDLLPIYLPEVFTKRMVKDFEHWLRSTCEYTSSYVCVSKTTKKTLINWLQDNNFPLPRIEYFHLGSDLPVLRENNAKEHLDFPMKLRDPCFLMVGTIEPRKQHLFVLKSFEILWNHGYDFTLMIIGKPGWKKNEILEAINNSNFKDKYLYYYPDADDSFLQHAYQNATSLIFASLGEGFGLPLVEALFNKKFIICRNLEIFKEIAGNSASYFDTKNPDKFAEFILGWVQKYKNGLIRINRDFRPITWHESCDQLLSRLEIEIKENSK